MREIFDALMPEQGKAQAEVIEELVALNMPGLRAITGPRFFGWMIGASHPAGVAADWLTSAWGRTPATTTRHLLPLLQKRWQRSDCSTSWTCRARHR